MWELDYNESRGPKNWCFSTVVLEKMRVPWTARRSNQSIPKEISPKYSLEGLMLKLKFQFWPPDGKSRLLAEYLDAGKDLRQEEKGTTDDEMVGWYHRLNGHESEQALGVGEGQGRLACCSLWGCNDLDMTEQLNWNWHKKSVVRWISVWHSQWLKNVAREPWIFLLSFELYKPSINCFWYVKFVVSYYW